MLPWESRQATSKAAEVLRKLPDCINEVTPAGHNRISLEDTASGRLPLPRGPLSGRGQRQWKEGGAGAGGPAGLPHLGSGWPRASRPGPRPSRDAVQTSQCPWFHSSGLCPERPPRNLGGVGGAAAEPTHLGAGAGPGHPAGEGARPPAALSSSLPCLGLSLKTSRHRGEEPKPLLTL